MGKLLVASLFGILSEYSEWFFFFINGVACQTMPGDKRSGEFEKARNVFRFKMYYILFCDKNSGVGGWYFLFIYFILRINGLTPNTEVYIINTIRIYVQIYQLDKTNVRDNFAPSVYKLFQRYGIVTIRK